MTRWLSDDQQAAWRSWLRATQLLGVALETQMQQDSGMPMTHYIVLAMLSEAPDRRLRMTDLAAQTQSSRSRLSHAIDRLQERGWVCREAHESDRRGQIAVLTEAGWEVVKATAPGHAERVMTAVFDRLSPEETAMLRVITCRIADGLERELVEQGRTRQRPIPDA